MLRLQGHDPTHEKSWNHSVANLDIGIEGTVL